MSAQNTIRDQLIERFTNEFGQPVINQETCMWSLARPKHAAVHVQMDSMCTPNRVAVWIFDPWREGRSAERSWVEHENEVQRMVEQIKRQVERAD